MCSYNLHCGRACLCVHVSHVLNRAVLFSNDEARAVCGRLASQRQWLVTYHGGWCHTSTLGGGW